MKPVGTESGIINRNYNEEVLFGKPDSVKQDNDSSFKTTEHKYFYEDYTAKQLKKEKTEDELFEE